MIKGIAKKISKKYGIDNEELENEGNFVFVKCFDRYQDRGFKFSTYLYNSLERELTKYARKLKNHEHDEMADIPYPYKIENDFTIDYLSTDAKHCISLAINPPEELLNFRARKDNTRWATKITMSLLRNYLVRNEGWKYKRVERCFTEIQVALQ